jgi:enoyl-[acyl-carrier protein] reductase III
MSSSSSPPFAALIAGGTKGIGCAIALKLAKPGAHIFLSYHSDESAAAKAAEQVREKDATAHLIRADVGNEDGGRQIIAQVAKVVPQLHALVHSAAVPNPGELATQDLARIRQAIEVGGMALLYLVQPAMKLLAQGSTVLFLTGASTHLVLPRHGALAAAKALGDCFVKYLAIECAAKGINFNSLGVGPVDTDLYRSVAPKSADGSPLPPPASPNGRRILPEDVAQVAAFLISEGGSMIRGQTVLVDGGMSTTVRSR